MSIDIKAPTFPESIQDGTIATWHKQPGEAVSRDELIVDIETDKVVLEVVAPADGKLVDIIKAEGDTVLSNEVIAKFEAGASGETTSEKADEAPAATSTDTAQGSDEEKLLSPAARKMAEENNIKPADIKGTG